MYFKLFFFGQLKSKLHFTSHSFLVPLPLCAPALRFIAVIPPVKLWLCFQFFKLLPACLGSGEAFIFSCLLKLLAREYYEAQWASWSPRCDSFWLWHVLCYLAKCGSCGRLRKRELFPSVPLQPPLKLGENAIFSLRVYKTSFFQWCVF